MEKWMSYFINSYLTTDEKTDYPCIYCFSSHLSYAALWLRQSGQKAVILYNQGMEKSQDGNLTLAAGLF